MMLALRGDFKHLRAEIEASGFGAPAREGKRNVTRPAAQIERAVAVFYVRQFHDAALPQPVQAEALEVVQEIIAAGDAGKEVIDLRGTLVAGRIIGVAHADSLAAAAALAKLRNVFAPGGGFAIFK